MEPLYLFDTTLRDGTQGENINFSAEEKLNIAKRLDEIGIHYIEGGWPGSNPRDMHFFELAKNHRLEHSKITAFGATRRPGISPGDDDNLNAILTAETPVVTIFGKSWGLHVKTVMENTPEENLAMIYESTAFLKDRGREVIYDAEHFFDGYKSDPGYAMETVFSAIDGGADIVVFCETNGGVLPHEIDRIIREVKDSLAAKYGTTVDEPVIPFGIHTHNDSGVAVANALAAVRLGAVMVQGTINGYGERCGNADLTTLIPILQCKMNRDCMSLENLKGLKKLSRYVSETANLVPNRKRPFVGKSAFAHKGGIHVSAIRKTPTAYEHMPPDIVGNSRRVLVSDLSGKSNIEYKADELGIDLGGNGYNSREIVQKIKELEDQGYQYDAAEGSFKILVEKLTGQYTPLFSLESFRIVMEKDKGYDCRAHAIVKLCVGDRDKVTAAEGMGPVSALDNALRRALVEFFPGLRKMGLVDYKVRVIDGRDGTSAKVRVLIESRDQEEVWATVGVSTDIIEASWKALEDSFQYKLAKDVQNAG